MTLSFRYLQIAVVISAVQMGCRSNRSQYEPYIAYDAVTILSASSGLASTAVSQQDDHLTSKEIRSLLSERISNEEFATLKTMRIDEGLQAITARPVIWMSPSSEYRRSELFRDSQEHSGHLITREMVLSSLMRWLNPVHAPKVGPRGVSVWTCVVIMREYTVVIDMPSWINLLFRAELGPLVEVPSPGQSQE